MGKREKPGRSPKIYRRHSANASVSTVKSASTPGQPSKKARKDDESSLLSANQYSVLNEHTAVNVSDLQGFGQEQDHCQDGPPTNVTVKLPPLIVKSISLEQLQKVLHAKGISAQFKFTRIGIKVMLQTMDEFVKAKTYLNQHKAQFFTHDMTSEKPFKVVVRGLPVMQPEDIKAELEEQYKL
ncbi:uncharacterized protein LOC131680456 [Topomyia yanbarensis]|uniref:uncharacterized protein LOC131680456 n=1 Tax=Topomyia yanbarensis TaxID=2498891 RepID=UPI00273CB8C9|nr:uncharacterized protein LOC131680456 [Topomyia yanbarensis]